MSRIKSEPLGVLIAAELRREILDGRLRSGEELRQEYLAERFGTSRIPVREAMQALERDGLILILPNRRSVVARFETEDIADHYRVRALIEGETAISCQTRRVDVSGLRKIQDALEALPDYDKQERHEELNKHFHSWIWQHAGSPWLERLADNLWQGISPYTPNLVPGQIPLAHAEHRRIIEAISGTSPDAAKEAMTVHILRSCDSLLHYRRSLTPAESFVPRGGNDA